VRFLSGEESKAVCLLAMGNACATNKATLAGGQSRGGSPFRGDRG
jgi:hypothetical protein